MEILSPQQLALADKDTIKSDKITSLELMERAAIGCFNWIKSRIKPEDVTIHIFCGIGNNGGDGLVIARHLQINNYKVNPYVVNFSHKRTNEFLENYEKLKELGDWPEVINSEKEFPKITENDLVIDAIFGIGLTRPATGFIKKLIEYLNRSKAFILSIDVPSGLFCNQPITDFNAIIKSNHLLTFQHPKLSFFLSNSKDFVSTWEVIDIGLNRNFIKNLDAKNHYVDKNFALNLYQYRTKWQHKGNFGHTLIFGGSYGKIGAVILSTKSALKIGSGLVSAYLPKCGYEVLQNAIPEAMVEVDEEKQLSFFNFKTKPNAIGIGPGMGTSEKTLLGFEGFLKTNKIPLVIDADALNLLSENKHLLKCIPKNSVLTPHPKELERLIGKWKNDFEKIEKIKAFSKKHNCIVVNKDAITAVIYKDECYFNSTGNVALATGGSGDTLTGIITGLMAQHYTPLNAAILGVYLHGLTADIGIVELGIEGFTATNIIDYLPDAFLNLLKKPDKNNGQ